MKNILNYKKPVFWLSTLLIVVLIVAGLVLLTNLLSSSQDDLSTLDGFTAALKRQLSGVVDITKNGQQEHPFQLTENQRVLSYDLEYILVEIAADAPVEDIVNKRLADINNPLLDRLWPVHLYRKGDLVVEYAGVNEKIIKALVKLLGDELPHDVPFVDLQDSINLQVSVSGMGVTNQDIQDDADKRVIQTAILDCNNSAAIWSGKPVDEMPDRVQILISQTPVGTTTQFTLIVDELGNPCLISNQNNRYCVFGENRFNELLAIVRKGFYENPAMTVRSGDNTIQAIGHWVNSYDKITKVSADSMYLPVKGIKVYLTYLPIDMANGVKGGSQPFAAYVNGQEIDGDFTIYDEQMNNIEVVEPSGLAPQMTIIKGLAPGRYIVEMQTHFETLTDESGYQYFFGIVIR